MTQRPRARSTPAARAAYRRAMIFAPLDATTLQLLGAALAYSGFVILAMRR